MKRRINIFVEVDDTAKPGASSTSALVKFDGKPASDGIEYGAWRVTIVPEDGPITGSQLDALRTKLAHELGHVVAAIFETPANTADPRSQARGNRNMDGAAEKVYVAEAEASDIAVQIDPTIDRDLLARNLATYKDPQLGPFLEMAAIAEQMSLILEAIDKRVPPSPTSEAGKPSS